MSESSLKKRLSDFKPIILDGATGTELSRRGVNIDGPVWTALAVEQVPDILTAIHQDYANAGAEVITANTFRTQRRTLNKVGRGGDDWSLTRDAVQIARDAVGDRCWIAGSIAPLEDCYSPDRTPLTGELESGHRDHVTNLVRAGVDLLLVETQITVTEAIIAARACHAARLPFLVSFVAGADGTLLSGERLADAVREILSLEPTGILVNCMPAEDVLPALGTLNVANLDLGATGLGAYPNTGRLMPDGSWEPTASAKSAVFAGFACDWMQAGFRWIGGCCGSSPEHISAVRTTLYGDDAVSDARQK